MAVDMMGRGGKAVDVDGYIRSEHTVGDNQLVL